MDVIPYSLSLIKLTVYAPQFGATPLHKAVLFYQPKIVKLIAEKYRITTRSKDQVSKRNIKGNLNNFVTVEATITKFQYAMERS